MTPERWQQIRDVLEKALELTPSRRSVFLDGACLSDQSLRRKWKRYWLPARMRVPIFWSLPHYE